MVIKHCNKNYPKEGINSISVIYYFVLNNEQSINLNETKYTDEEKEGNFELRYINLNNIDNILKESIPNNDENQIIAYEMLDALNK